MLYSFLCVEFSQLHWQYLMRQLSFKQAAKLVLQIITIQWCARDVIVQITKSYTKKELSSVRLSLKKWQINMASDEYTNTVQFTAFDNIRWTKCTARTLLKWERRINSFVMCGYFGVDSCLQGWHRVKQLKLDLKIV